MSEIFIKTFPVGAFQCNCTILADQNTKEAIIIDPGDEPDKIINEVQANGFEVKYLLHTHAHIDHISGTKKVCQQTSSEICLHKDDQFLYDNLKMQSDLLGMNVDSEVLPVQKYIEHGDEISLKEFGCHVLHTPGHTPGSVSFLVQSCELGEKKLDLLFSGDTLFMNSIGRTDLWGGDYPQIIASIKEKLLTLSDDTIVIAGHGPKTTIGHERKGNPFLNGAM